jgi:hypothetical protein
VEVLAGRTQRSASAAVDRAIVDFHALARVDYPGLLVAIYDEESPAGDPRLRERFRSAGPERSLLLPTSEAVSTIVQRLGRVNRVPPSRPSEPR